MLLLHQILCTWINDPKWLSPLKDPFLQNILHMYYYIIKWIIILQQFILLTLLCQYSTLLCHIYIHIYIYIYACIYMCIYIYVIWNNKNILSVDTSIVSKKLYIINGLDLLLILDMLIISAFFIVSLFHFKNFFTNFEPGYFEIGFHVIPNNILFYKFLKRKLKFS